MPRAGGGALLLITGGALLYLLTRDSAPTVYADGSTEAGDVAPPDVAPVYVDNTGADAPEPDMSASDPVASFLYAIRCSEHNALDVASGTDFFRFYGGATFTGTDDHPVATGELRGVPLPPEMCRAAGIASGKCVSTAAGGYQFTLPTWREFGGGLAFDPNGQTTAARRVLDKSGATPKILAGDIAGAVALASKRWASLPGSTAKQGGRSLDFFVTRFNDAQAGQELA